MRPAPAGSDAARASACSSTPARGPQVKEVETAVSESRAEHGQLALFARGLADAPGAASV